MPSKNLDGPSRSPQSPESSCVDAEPVVGPAASRARPSMTGASTSRPLRHSPLVQGDDATGSPTQADLKSSDDVPAWTELKTKAGKERKRLPLACMPCRKKKIRCSGEKPVCEHCAHAHTVCVYKVTVRKPTPRTDYMAMLDKRLKRMEDRVIKVMPKDDQRSANVIGRAVVKPSIASASSQSRKRAADQAFAEDLPAWAQPPAHNRSSTPLPPPPAASDQLQPDIVADGSECLPSAEMQEHLAETYFEYIYGQAYHLLHKPTYMKRLAAAQLPAVLNLAVCAVAARFSTHPSFGDETVYLRGEQWAKPAREIALRRYDTPNLTIIMTFLLLGLHEFGTCHGGRSWMLGGMAQRMAYALQLHKDVDPKHHNLKGSEGRKLPQTDRETRLRTMWACFTMDRFNSSGTDRPPFLAEQYIEAKLPIKESLYIAEVAGPTEFLAPPDHINHEARNNMGCPAYIVRIVAIWGDVVRYLNLGGREQDKHSIWSEHSGFRQLLKQIERFQTDLPEELRWSKANLAAHASEAIANQFIFMHIVLQQVILFMNRLALPMPGSSSTLPKDTPVKFVNDCIRAALDAANHTSTLLREAFQYRVVAPFAGYAAYFSSTVHIYGLGSKAASTVDISKQCLAVNIRFLARMRQYWGMFHFVTEHLKELYRKQTEIRDHHTKASICANGSEKPVTILQYGDWFDKFPNGVSTGEPTPATQRSNSEHRVSQSDGDLPRPIAGGTPVAKQATAVPAPVRKDKERPERKRVKSVVTSLANIPSSPPLYSPRSGPDATQAPISTNRPSLPQSGPRGSFSDAKLLALDTGVSTNMNSGHLSGVQARFSPTHRHFPTSSLQPSYEYMPSGSAVQGPTQSFMRMQQQPQQQQQQQPAMNHSGLMYELDRQMVMSSYAGMDSVGAPPQSAGGMMPGLNDSGISNGQSILMPPLDYSTGIGPPAARPRDSSAAYGNMVRESDPTATAWNGSSAWFLPFNYDPRTGISNNAATNIIHPTGPSVMNMGGIDLDAIMAGLPEFSGDSRGSLSGPSVSLT